MNKSKLKGRVVRVRNEVVSRAVQEAFFRADVFWLEGQEHYLNSPTLRYGDEAYLGYDRSFFGKDMGIRCANKGDIETHSLSPISLEEFFKLMDEDKEESEYLEVIHVPTPELSALVQEILFKEGVVWHDGERGSKVNTQASLIFKDRACLSISRTRINRLGYDKKSFYKEAGVEVLTVEEFFVKRMRSSEALAKPMLDMINAFDGKVKLKFDVETKEEPAAFLKTMAVRVPTEAVSRAVQEALFRVGRRWSMFDGGKVFANDIHGPDGFLSLLDSGRITRGKLDEDIVISLDMFFELLGEEG
ncbi:MAG: hypothetical protein KAR06_08870 [Deltaproteobacteria bacterium]|nr:hypothetical protein [Deltaproteobacteria bacterium]